MTDTFINDPNEINRLLASFEPDALEITATVHADSGSVTKALQDQNIGLKLCCGQKVEQLQGNATAIYKGGKRVDVSKSISWEWNSKPQATGPVVSARSLLDPLTEQFNRSTTAVTIKARIEVGSKRKFARFQLAISCDVSSIKAKPNDTVLLTRLIYAEAADAPTDDERAAVGWSVLNRKAAIRNHPTVAKSDFGENDQIATVIAHVNKQGKVQYEAYSKGRAQLERERVNKKPDPKTEQWNKIDRPEQLNCNECAMLKKCAQIAEGILSGKIKDPYAARGGSYFFHLEKDGVASGERKFDIVRLPKRADFTHHFWTREFK